MSPHGVWSTRGAEQQRQPQHTRDPWSQTGRRHRRLLLGLARSVAGDGSAAQVTTRQRAGRGRSRHGWGTGSPALERPQHRAAGHGAGGHRVGPPGPPCPHRPPTQGLPHPSPRFCLLLPSQMVTPSSSSDVSPTENQMSQFLSVLSKRRGSLERPHGPCCCSGDPGVWGYPCFPATESVLGKKEFCAALKH